jgi:hypothetical protein
MTLLLLKSKRIRSGWDYKVPPPSAWAFDPRYSAFFSPKPFDDHVLIHSQNHVSRSPPSPGDPSVERQTSKSGCFTGSHSRIKKHYRIDGPSVCQSICTEYFDILMIVAIRLANEVKSHWNKRCFGGQRLIHLAGWIKAAVPLHTSIKQRPPDFVFSV